MVGEICLANIYFTDSSDSKIRPNLLVKKNNFGDLIYLPLTSNLVTQGSKIDTEDMQDGKLPKASVVVYEEPGVIAHRLLVRKIGTIRVDVFKRII